MKLPVTRVRMPACLVGQQNGRLDDSLLVSIGLGKHRLIAPAARAWHAMRAAAWEAGHKITVTSTYRDYPSQVDTYAKKPTLAAKPGTSNHGLGLAVDVSIDADGDPGYEWPPKSLDKPALGWLIDNAHRFGWSWERQDEPWHLRYVAGDQTPAAVADHDTKETTMLVLDYKPDTPAWVAMLTTGTTIAHIVNGHADQVWRAGNVRRVTVTKEQLGGVLATVTKVGASPFAAGNPWSDADLDARWRP